MRILLTGGTGFIGQALVPALLERDCELLVLSRQRHPDRPRCRYLTSLEQIGARTRVDAIVNLAGASLAGRRWTGNYKQEILASRHATTRAVVSLVGRLQQPPAVLLSGSAIGYYGHHGSEILTEDAPSTPGFAQALCADWEAIAEEAGHAGTRVCLLRLGVVLDAGGGALEQMARSFQLGVGSWIGSGEQWLSWVHRSDVVAALLYLLDHPVLTGPFNITAPEPVTAREFCATLARYYRVRFSMPVPAPLARLLLGEMADELLIGGQRVVPQRLRDAGFDFRHPTLDSALQAICSP